MDKIIELICEEARRRPGSSLALKLHEVIRELDERVNAFRDELLYSELQGGIINHLKEVHHYGPGSKQPGMVSIICKGKN